MLQRPDAAPTPHDQHGVLGRLGQAAIDALTTPVAVVRPDGRIVAVNRAWTAFSEGNGGDPARTGVGVNYLAVCEAAPRGSEAGALGAGLRDVLSGRREQILVEYPCHSPEERRWYRARVTPVTGSDGRPEYAVVAHEDVTAARLADLRHHQLDDEVGQRTQALREANDELDAFAASVSHDLRAPVRHVQGFLSLLRRRLTDGRLDANETRMLDIVESASVRLGTMIDEMLNLSRVSRAGLRAEQVDVAEIVRDVWRNLTPGHEARDLRLVLHDTPGVRADPGLLRLALENLLGNAVKYTGHVEHAEVHVGGTCDDAECVVWVRDNGVGFDPRYADRLFRPFQRLHRDDEFEGVGMGLINVRRIVVKHGGRVWAESQPGRGATFYLALPTS
ncbi:PAS domain-containing sensor histidine kinase [Deinococcus pimensis]|uniref:PAS domain-containing sensor histidine kinase n=1 Tax=Deinococcus pimensis TaxID=309888 RepID=UPI0004859146|nr:ATP-binding protein [Deinococcus pimensis]